MELEEHENIFIVSTLWLELIKQSRRMLVFANDVENEFYIERRGHTEIELTRTEEQWKIPSHECDLSWSREQHWFSLAFFQVSLMVSVSKYPGSCYQGTTQTVSMTGQLLPQIQTGQWYNSLFNTDSYFMQIKNITCQILEICWPAKSLTTLYKRDDMNEICMTKHQLNSVFQTISTE